jgi:two-component system, sensor histidine kinase
MLLTELLADRFEVRVASNGDEAIELATKESFDMILMDINLGHGLTGVDVVEKLRNDDALYASTPIVALTAYALPGDRERFLEQGFTAHLRETVQPGSLLRLIRKLNL